MDRAVEWFLATTTLIIGASHILRPGDWHEAYRQLHRCGRLGAFDNGGLSLLPGALMVTAHGWLLIVKACLCFLLPDVTLHSMQRSSQSPRGFMIAGVVLLIFSGWLWFSLWTAPRI